MRLLRPCRCDIQHIQGPRWATFTSQEPEALLVHKWLGIAYCPSQIHGKGYFGGDNAPIFLLSYVAAQ